MHARKSKPAARKRKQKNPRHSPAQPIFPLLTCFYLVRQLLCSYGWQTSKRTPQGPTFRVRPAGTLPQPDPHRRSTLAFVRRRNSLKPFNLSPRSTTSSRILCDAGDGRRHALQRHWRTPHHPRPRLLLPASSTALEARTLITTPPRQLRTAASSPPPPHPDAKILKEPLTSPSSTCTEISSPTWPN